jgi:ABC-type methionine transport system permease subunit
LKSPVKHCAVIGMLGSGPPLQLTVAAGFTVKTDETSVAEEAVIVTAVAVATLPDETENVALVLPAGIVTEDGTTAAALPLETDMTTPPVGAGPTATTVPVEPFPLTTEFGARARDESPIVAGVTVTEAVPDLVKSWVLVAVTVAVVAFAGAV